MALPRSNAGFEKAIKEAQEEINAVTNEINDATPEQEDALYEKKADLEVALGVLEQKFEEFKANEEAKANAKEDESSEDKAEDGESEEPASEEPKPEDKPEPKPEPEPEEDKTPEVGLVTVLKGGYMVDPFTHIKFVEHDYKEVVITDWIKNQVKAGIMAIK